MIAALAAPSASCPQASLSHTHGHTHTYRGPERAISPVPFSESENDEYNAASKAIPTTRHPSRVPHKVGGGDALEEDLEMQVRCVGVERVGTGGERERIVDM